MILIHPPVIFEFEDYVKDVGVPAFGKQEL